MKGGQRGFALIAAAMTVFLTSALALCLSLKIALHWRLVQGVETQLYSLVLAQNGLEYAASRLPALELDSLLTGPDGRLCGTESPEWRSPMPFDEALTVEPGTWTPECDDGLLLPEGPPWGREAPGSGYFFLKASNNPEEDANGDADREVIVRSLGIVPLGLPWPETAGVRNSTALVEARFRQETSFLLPSPLTLFGDLGFFAWGGTLFSIEADNRPAVSVVAVSEPGLTASLLGSLTPEQAPLLRGSGGSPSLENATAAYRADPSRRFLFDSDFWKHFLEGLPRFAGDLDSGIAFLPEGGVLDVPFEGILIARGNFALRAGAEIRGLLLHLGNGTLRLQEGSTIEGAVWVSNLDLSRPAVQSGPLFLDGSGAFRIRYDGLAVREALSLLPATRLGWRILFPEMVR